MVFAIQSLFTSVSTTSPNLPDLYQEWKYHEVSPLLQLSALASFLQKRRQPKNITSAFWTVWCSLDRLLEHIPTICEYFAPGKSTSCSGHFGPVTDQNLQRIGHPIRWALFKPGFRHWVSSYGILWDPEKWNAVFSANRMVWDGVTMNYEPRTIQPKQILLNSMFVWMCVDVHSDQHAYNLNLERFVKLQVWRYMKLPSNWSCRQCLDKVHL